MTATSESWTDREPRDDYDDDAPPDFVPPNAAAPTPSDTWGSVPQLTEQQLADDDQEAAESLERIRFNEDVSSKLRRLRIDNEAHRRFDSERRADLPPFDAGTLAELMQRPADPPSRIEELMPSQSSMLVTALRKSGKTVFNLNLARSLITGEDFLGRFGVRKLDGNLAILNFEVSAAMLTAWASDVGIPPDRLYVVNLRGRSNPFAHEEDLVALAALLRQHDVEALATDPFGRAYTGKSQNDPGEVGAWLADLDRFARGDVGATDLILSAHAGWEGERTRGSSALEDWPDAIVTIVRDAENTRYMRAIGRDVDIEEDRLDYDPHTRRLTLAGTGSRKATTRERRLDTQLEAALTIATQTPGLNGAEMGTRLRSDGLGLQKGEEYKILKAALAAGVLRYEPGKGVAKHYYPALPRDHPGGAPEVLPPPPSLWGGGTQDTDQEPLPRDPTATTNGPPT
jgi:AAA domain